MSQIADSTKQPSASSVQEPARTGRREPPAINTGTCSSLFEKLPPDLRRAVDIAIAEHVPPTFQAVWMQFELAKFGVSFSSFYRYARRLRERVNLVEAAALAAEDDADVDAVLRKLTGRRALDLLLHTQSSECLKEITALVSAHAQAAWLDIADRRLALNRRRLDEDSNMARARLELDRDHVRLKSEALQLSRRALENRPAKALRLTRTEPDSKADAKSPSPSASEPACRLADAE